MAVLLAVTTARRTPRVYQAVFDAARARGERVVAFFAVDPHMTDQLTRHLSEDTMLDARSCETLERALVDEYEARGRRKLDEVAAAAHAAGVESAAELERGDFIRGCLACARRRRVADVYVPRRHDSPLGRYLFGRGIDARLVREGLAVHVVEETP